MADRTEESRKVDPVWISDREKVELARLGVLEEAYAILWRKALQPFIPRAPRDS